MLSPASILALFGQLIVACIGLFGIVTFVKKIKSEPQNKYFYSIVLLGPIFGQFTLGVAGFFVPLAYMLTTPEITAYLIRYHYLAILIASWSIWAILNYIFTNKKNVWHVWLLAAVVLPSAVIITLTSSAVQIDNQSGIVSPTYLKWQGTLFNIESLSIYVISLIYTWLQFKKHKRAGKPVGYIATLLAGLAFFTMTFVNFGIYLQYQYSLFYVLAWVCASAAIIFFYFLGILPFVDENKALLAHPLLYIKRSLKFKMLILLNTCVWLAVSSATLVMSALIARTPSLSLDAHIAREVGRTQAWFLLVSLVILSIATFFISYFVSALLKPIDYLKQGVKIIGQGNFAYRIFAITNDELGRLASEFNDMAINLQKKTQEIFRLQRIDSIKSQFIATASHQLRTPLTAIRWSLTSLLPKNKQQTMPQEGEQSMIAQAYESTNKVIETVNRLLDLSQLESEKIILRKETVGIPSLIEEILKTMTGIMQEKKIHATTSYDPPDNFPSLSADKHFLQMAIENIIANAAHYNKRSGSIHIAAKDEKDAVLISVADTGVGITEEDSVNLFSRFYRGANAVSLKTDGSGLGLFIARAITAAHKGAIWFEQNKKGESPFSTGTTFYIRLPK